MDLRPQPTNSTTTILHQLLYHHFGNPMKQQILQKLTSLVEKDSHKNSTSIFFKVKRQLHNWAASWYDCSAKSTSSKLTMSLCVLFPHLFRLGNLPLLLPLLRLRMKPVEPAFTKQRIYVHSRARHCAERNAGCLTGL